MAAGVPYLSTYGEALLVERLTDPLLAQYCPGCAGEGRLPGGTKAPTVRFWLQSPGTDKPRQDGRQGRVLSLPTYVVVALDRQAEGPDKVCGTVGMRFDPPRPYLQLAQARIYDLLHGQRFGRDGFSYAVECLAEYAMVEALEQGGHDVQLGWWTRLTVT